MTEGNTEPRFSKYKRVRVNGVFDPELASYPVTIPPLFPTNYSVTQIPSTPSCIFVRSPLSQPQSEPQPGLRRGPLWRLLCDSQFYPEPS